MQGLIFNMMTGNIQGYEDINKQRALENNYQFSWNQNLIQDVEKKISDLEGEEADHVEDNAVMDEVEVVQVEELLSVVPEVLDIYQGGDERQRPPSLHSKTGEADSDQDQSQDSSDKDEL